MARRKKSSIEIFIDAVAENAISIIIIMWILFTVLGPSIKDFSNDSEPNVQSEVKHEAEEKMPVFK